MLDAQSHVLKTISIFSNNDKDPCSCLRVFGPFEDLGINIFKGNEGDNLDLDSISKADVVLIQRVFPANLAFYNQVVQKARAANKPIVFDIDDFLFELPDGHPEKDQHKYTESLIPIMRAISEANVVTVSTSILRDALLPLNKNIFILPNFLDDHLWKFRDPVLQVEDFKPVVIGYMGSTSHLPDLAFLNGVLKNLLDRYQDRIKILFWGISPPIGIEQYPNVSWEPSKTYLYREFSEYFQTQSADILIAPLADNLFNRCKSGIKYLEYTALGAPGVYSNLPPYSDIITNGYDGFLATTENEWFDAITRLVDDAALRFEMGVNAQKTTRAKWLLSKNSQKWAKLYNSLLDPTKQSIKIINRHPSPILETISEQLFAFHNQNRSVLQEKNVVIEQKDQQINAKNIRIEELENIIIGLSDKTRGLDAIIQDLTGKLQTEEISIGELEEETGREIQTGTFYEQEINKFSEQMRFLEQSNQAIKAELVSIKQSRSWRLIAKIKRINDWFLPEGSIQEKALIKFYAITINRIINYLRRRRIQSDIALIRASELFDAAWYLETNPDVAQASVDPVTHYYHNGAFEGRSASPQFNSAWYLQQYPDVKIAGLNPLIHYLRYGKKEGRRSADDRLQNIGNLNDSGEQHGLLKENIPNRTNEKSTMWQREFYFRSPSISSRLAHFNLLASKGIKTIKDEGARELVKKVYHRYYLQKAEHRSLVFENILGNKAERPLGIRSKLLAAMDLVNLLNQKMTYTEYICSISHDNYVDNVGGVQIRISDEQISFNNDCKHYLHIYPYKYSPYLIHGKEPFIIGITLDGEEIGKSESDDFISALEIVNKSKLTQFNLHHLMGFNMAFILKLLSNQNNVPVRYWVHDFFTLCPNYALLRNNLEYCGVPQVESNACTICIYQGARIPHLPEFVRLFTENKIDVVAPSEFAIKFWQEKIALPIKSSFVLPHAKVTWGESSPSRNTNKPLRIAFVGSPVNHKGWSTFKKLTDEIKNNSQYEFFLFANNSVGLGNFRQVDVSVNQSNRLKMVQELRKHEIDVAVLWSICPETFSFTLYESLSAGCFVLTNPNSGNIQDFIRHNPGRGAILENAQQLLDIFHNREILDMVDRYQKGGRPMAKISFKAGVGG